MILKPSHWMVQQATGQVRLCFDGISMISGFIIHMVLLCFIKKQSYTQIILCVHFFCLIHIHDWFGRVH